MNSQTIGLRVASVVFGLMAIAQLVRLSDTPRGARGRSSDAVVAKCAGLHHFERSESLDVETCTHADQMNEIGIRLTRLEGPLRRAGVVRGRWPFLHWLH